MGATRIIDKVPKVRFEHWLDTCRIIVNPHALDRLSEAQRKVFKGDELIDILTKGKPILIGLQKNGRYAVFFKRSDGFIRIIFQISEDGKIEIGTFYNVDQLP